MQLRLKQVKKLTKKRDLEIKCTFSNSIIESFESHSSLESGFIHPDILQFKQFCQK